MSTTGPGGEATATRHSYDAVAERYRAEIGDELAGKPLDRGLLAVVVELAGAGDGPIVDLGCGPGHVAAQLSGHGPPVIGVDVSPAMCAAARRATGLPFAVGDLVTLPLRSSSVAGIVCWYAVIHLDAAERAAAYREMVRVLRPGGHALVAFHVAPPGTAEGSADVTMTEWWGREVSLTFRFLDPAAETDALASAGLRLTARLDRAPHPEVEHPSHRSYLLAVRARTGA